MSVTLVTGITLGIALLGATLGVLNIWQSFYRDQLRVKVSPRKAFANGREPRICFEIVNRGYLPVTISSIGLRLRRPRHREFFAFIAQTIDGGSLPQRMEPRTSITLFMPIGADQDPLIREAKGRIRKDSLRAHFSREQPNSEIADRSAPLGNKSQ